LTPRAHKRVSALCALALAPLLLAASDSAPIALRAQIWTQSGDAAAHALTHAPGECLASSSADIEIGRALFRAPALLGGPAARVGLSCDSCHANGRDNPHFILPELTDRPGAADVTSEWASRTRGDGAMNPRRIPDLTDVRITPPYGQGHVLSLDGFVASVIIDEFQGEAPPPAAFAGLIAYLGALQSDACPSQTETPITLASAAEDVRRALAAAQSAEPDTARLVLLAAQEAIGRIAERLPAAEFADERRALVRLSRELANWRGASDIRARLETSLPAWRARFNAQIAQMERRTAQTYFDPETLARALYRNGAPHE
jgi:hypothetical protein